MLSEAHVMWTFVHDDAGRVVCTWDIGHTVTAQPDGEPAVEWQVGDPRKATTSRRTVERSISQFLEERDAAGAG